jgi:hypothetical protein
MKPRLLRTTGHMIRCAAQLNLFLARMSPFDYWRLDAGMGRVSNTSLVMKASRFAGSSLLNWQSQKLKSGASK